ncbi:hypothetical protein GGR56DRAFT_157811 [Xylariaceae sp. FL0804]|nr:hypothetical protein GGR56DRAFT_157811 [Xylariaceae sp. FL0804]
MAAIVDYVVVVSPAGAPRAPPGTWRARASGARVRRKRPGRSARELEPPRQQEAVTVEVLDRGHAEISREHGDVESLELDIREVGHEPVGEHGVSVGQAGPRSPRAAVQPQDGLEEPAVCHAQAHARLPQRRGTLRAAADEGAWTAGTEGGRRGGQRCWAVQHVDVPWRWALQHVDVPWYLHLGAPVTREWRALVVEEQVSIARAFRRAATSQCDCSSLAWDMAHGGWCGAWGSRSQRMKDEDEMQTGQCKKSRPLRRNRSPAVEKHGPCSPSGVD